MVIHPEVIAL